MPRQNKINKKTRAKKQTPLKIPLRLPLIPIRDLVVFPNMILPLFVGRAPSIKAIEAAFSSDKMVMLASQITLETENPDPHEIYSHGTVGTLLRMLRMPDGRVKILVQGLNKAKIVDFVQTQPYYAVEIQIKKAEKKFPKSVSLNAEAEMRTLKERMEKVVSMGKALPPDFLVLIESTDDPGRLADLVASNLTLKVDLAQEILETDNPVDRLIRVNELLSKEVELLTLQHKIASQAKDGIDRTQRDYFLREQLKAIQKELGESDERSEEIEELRVKIADAKMPEKVSKEAEKQLKRLSKMHPDSAESGTVRTYLESLIELPWNKITTDHLNLVAAKHILDEDHYNLEKVKERILEYLAVRKLKEDMKGPILCFVGSPGVGKTSLGKSIARAMGREFVRISLGGIRDEAEIRGHRRTYVGALPGKIIQGLKQSGTKNPVFMLDEIDKIGLDFRGDPASALLEVLDPEQNRTFTDHYLGVPFDLSQILFITTANQTDPIPHPLRDRMEIIEIASYTTEEKVGIAKKFLVPKQRLEHGITGDAILFDEAGIEQIILQYTKEAGVRNLEREIAHVMRKVARQVVEGDVKCHSITKDSVSTYLGVPKYLPEAKMTKDEVGVATGMAWTAVGGDLLQIEAVMIKGKGKLTLTGSLGDVMKESAHAALSYIRSREKQFHIDPSLFTKNDIHIHVPSGAIPKDGPSAGITMASAIASILTNTPVDHLTAMTGEVTLRGHVLPIGGLKEKVLAARRAGIKRVILPKQNEKDLAEIPVYLRNDLQFVLVDHMDQVLAAVLQKEAPQKPLRVGKLKIAKEITTSALPQ
ncbi:MAG: endopeptidase La [Nitrospirota bacterium]